MVWISHKHHERLAALREELCIKEVRTETLRWTATVGPSWRASVLAEPRLPLRFATMDCKQGLPSVPCGEGCNSTPPLPPCVSAMREMFSIGTIDPTEFMRILIWLFLGRVTHLGFRQIVSECNCLLAFYTSVFCFLIFYIV